MNNSVHAKPVTAIRCTLRALGGPTSLNLVIAMKLTLLLILAFSLGALADGYAQKIDLSVENATMKRVLRELRKQSGYAFIYKDEYLRDTRPVTARIAGKELTDALPKIFSGQPVDYRIEGKVITVMPKTGASSKPNRHPERSAAEANGSLLVLAIPIVKGKIVDSTGTALVGASIRVLNAEGKRTTLQTTTDSHGEFTLRNVPEDAVLEISYVGYITATLRASADVGSVVLKAVQSELEEVEVSVSTGYQIISKERATGSFATVSNEILRERVSTNIIDRIDGVASGVIFNRGVSGTTSAYLSTGNLTIRGLSTLGEGSIASPLVVLDNFPYHGDINNINPNDIEQITILKDAAAGSIWGAKAGNGVIVITTKKAKFNERPKIQFQHNTHIFDKPDLYYVPQMPTSEYIDLEIDLFDKGHFDNAILSTSPSASSAEISPVVTLLAAARAGTVDRTEAMRQIDQYRGYDIREDWLKYKYRNQVNQQYALQLTGGGNLFNYYISGGYDKNLEGIRGNDHERLSLLSRSEIKPSDRMNIQLSLSYVNQRRNTFGTSNFETTISGKRPYMRLADEDGTPIALPNVYSTRFLDGLSAENYLDWQYKPLDELRLNDNTTSGIDLTAGIMISYRIADGLDLSSRYQFQQYQTLNRDHSPVESYRSRDLINLYTKPGDSWDKSAVPYGGILDLTRSSLQSHQWRGQLSYQKRHGFAEVMALGGAEVSERRISSDRNRTYGYNDDLTTASSVDLINPYPTSTGIEAKIPTYFGIDEEASRFVSLFANGSVEFYDRYSLTASLRKDASNLFGVETNNRWKPLWSVGGKWRLSSERFYDFAALPELSLRATYGHQGNINNAIAAVTTILYSSAVHGDFRLNNFPKALVNNFPNPDLRWENVGTVNVAVDFATKRSKVNGSLEYYSKRASDIIVQDPVDPTTGVGNSIRRNAGKLHTYGLDLILNSSILKKGDFSWKNTFIFSWNDNKVVKYDLTPTSVTTLINDGYYLQPTVGKRAYTLVSYPFAGLNPLTGAPRGYVDGQISEDYRSITGTGTKISDLIYGGSSRARFYGGFRNALSWKDVSLAFNLTYSLGHYFRVPALSSYGFYEGVSIRNPVLSFYDEYLSRWQKPGDELYTSSPSLEYPADTRESFIRATEPYIENAGVIKLQYINLSYSLEKFKYAWLPATNCRLFLSASDLGIIWKGTKRKIDPDTRQQPLPRNFSFGLNIGF